MFLSINCEFLEVFLEKEGGGGSIIWPLGTIFILSLSFFFLIRKMILVLIIGILPLMLMDCKFF